MSVLPHTGVEFLPCGCAGLSVSYEVGLCEEGFSAGSTLERFVTGVNARVAGMKTNQ